MKQILLAFIAFTYITGTATAQVSKTDFLNKLNAYTNAKSAEKGSALAQLNDIMNTQMAFLKSDIVTRLTKAQADLANADAEIVKADTAKARAEADLTAANNELNKGNDSKAMADIEKAKTTIAKAVADKHKAHADREAANKELTDANNSNISLETEKKAYNDIQTLKKDLATESKITDELKTFASTLN